MREWKHFWFHSQAECRLLEWRTWPTRATAGSLMNQGRFDMKATGAGNMCGVRVKPGKVPAALYTQTLFFIFCCDHTASMAEHDLTQTIVGYLDRHLAFPLLAHLVETGIFPVEQVHQAQYELALGTNMVDYAATLFDQIHPDEEPPAGESILSVC